MHLTLREKYWLLNGLRVVEVICMFLGGVLAVTDHLLYFLLVFAAILFYRHHTRLAKIYRAGLYGEKRAGKLLKSLPRTYHKRHGVHVVWNGYESELDYLVVGPTGVFVIEVKNMSGVIRGSEDEQNWTQNKTLKSGKPFVHEFYNPTKQVGTHAKRLGKFLNHELQYKEKILVQPMVLFVHDNVQLELHDIRTPVFTEIEPLVHFILNREVKLKKSQIREILSEI